MKPIILASASPRRKDLLDQIGLEYDIVPSNHIEEMESNSDPNWLAKSLALQKAEVVASKHENAIVIAADTFIVFDNRIIGKPHTPDEAREMLMLLNGKTHSVITGFSIVDSEDKRVLSESVQTEVHMKKLTDEEINSYIASGEPIGKAGGYAIQGLGALIIDRIEGDYFNVVGLPLNALAEGLKGFGIRIL